MAITDYLLVYLHLSRILNLQSYFFFCQVYYHLIQTYIPSALFVIIAWLSLAIDPSAIPGRISMVMMTLLTLMAMFSGVRQMVPKVRLSLHQ